jgi:hypothetical protein
MQIEINNCGDLVGYAHLYRQQYTIDNQIDHDEFLRRLGWIDFDNNVTKFADDLALDSYANDIIQEVLNLKNTS